MAHRLGLLLALALFAGSEVRAGSAIRVLIWDEQQPEQRATYGGRFIGETLAAALADRTGLVVRITGPKDTGNGVDPAVLDETDVLVWWSHRICRTPDRAATEPIVTRVQQGRLHLLTLHSAHWSPPFVRLMQERAKADARALVPEPEHGSVTWVYANEDPAYKMLPKHAPLTPSFTRSGDVCRLILPRCVFPAWRADGAPSTVTMLQLDHPIAAGLPATWVIPQTEMYSEPFHVPEPDAVVLEERWAKGEHFRSGCIWTVGKGRVFYFRPGHETYPVYTQSEVLRVIENAIRWLPADS